MATTMTKIGKCFLAVVLSAFVCMYTPEMEAFAEEETATNEAATDTTVAEPVDTVATQADEAEVADADAAVTDAVTDTESADGATTVSLMALSADEATNPLDMNANPFDVSNFMELRDAFKYEINTQSGQSFVINLTDDITLEAPPTKYRDEAAHKYVFTMDTHNNRYNTGTDALSVKNGNTVTILGHGHSLLFTDRTVNNIIPGTRGGNLILGAADGSDALTFNFVGSNQQLGSMVDAVGGTVAIHSGVTLSNNVNATAYPGGGVNVSSGAVLNMDGGVIENCSNTNITWGGGVNVDGGTFNMSGGTIKGNSEKQMGDYLGFGGGVALGAHGTASTFTMSGNAVIEGNSAPYGGGVYVGPNSTFTMSGNAAVTGNTGSTYGGGVYVAQSGTFTMDGSASVTGNSSPYGGGVLNFGAATVTNVYDNDASVAGADIYNDGTLTMDDIHGDWALSRDQATSDLNASSGSTGTSTDIQPPLPGIKFMSMLTMAEPAYAADAATATVGNPSNKTIDGWYYDGHRETGDTDESGNAVVEHNRWNANADTADTPQYLQSYAVTGQPTTETMGLKAAHGAADTETPATPATVNVFWEQPDGTVLFELDKVEVGHVPEADAYNALSGHDDPTEAGDTNHEHEFEGWDRTDEPNGDVVYMAMYDDTDTPVDPSDPQAQTTDPEDPANPDEGTPATEPEKNTDVGSLQQTGDKVLALGFGLAAVALFSLGGLCIAKRRASKN